MANKPYRTTHPTSASNPLSWIKAAFTTIGRRLHAGPDAAARRLGWHVTSTRWGLGRVYRDPRFGQRADEPPEGPPGERP